MNAMPMKCDCCSASVLFRAGETVARCGFCRREMVRPNSTGEALRDLERANELWSQCSFGEAAAQYQQVLAKNPSEYEARWKLMLCRYGVEYVTEAKTGKRYILCHLSRTTALRNEPDYLRACALAPAEVRARYEEDAAYIDSAQAEIRLLKEQEERPWEVFICFKDQDDQTGNRTDDSVYAEAIYHRLTDLGYSVFYSNLSLTAKAGEDYEAAIHRAIETSKVMLAIGTRQKYYESTWVKSEWTRFLRHRAEQDPAKVLIPLYSGNPLIQPIEFRNMKLQGFDLATDYLPKLEKALDTRLRKAKRDREQVEALLAKIREYEEKYGRLEPTTPQGAPPEPPPADPTPVTPDPLRVQQTLTQGLEQLNRQNYTQARQCLETAAALGSAEAAYRLGLMYLQGKGVGQAAARARSWLEAAAQQGHADARAVLSHLKPPQPEPVSWQQGAEQGDAEAQYRLGMQYLRGEGRPKDESWAQIWLEKAAGQGHAAAQEALEALTGPRAQEGGRLSKLSQAAEQGDAEAQYGLGMTLLYGAKADRDPDQGMRWLEKAAGQGHAAAIAELEKLMPRRGPEQAADPAATTEDGVRRYNRQQYGEARRIFLDRAKAGDARAMRYLGQMCLKGEGMTASVQEGVMWLRQAGDHGDNLSQYKLGRMYHHGEGVLKDEAEARRWYGLSAAQGNRYAHDALQELNGVSDPAPQDKAAAGYRRGMAYLRGEGVPKNPSEAARLLRESADLGYPASQYELGGLYEKGNGVALNPKEAARWYLKAAEQGHVASQKRLGWLYESGTGVDKSGEQALRWYGKAADRGDKAAQEACKRLNRAGKPQDEQTPAKTLYFWAEKHRKGDGVPKNPQEAARLMLQAATQGHMLAQNEIGTMYHHGEGVPRDDRQAVSWWRKAAGQGYATAMCNLGLAYAGGLGVKQDFKAAVDWYGMAAKRQIPDAAYRLAMMYENGQGVPKNPDKAISLYEQAAPTIPDAKTRAEKLKKRKKWKLW